MSKTAIDCSIVIPVYHNEGSLVKTFEQIMEKVVKNNKELLFEIIFVDDGSGDNSLAVLLDLKKSNKIIRVIKLSRNFGQASAILAGFTHARGRTIVTLSADMQDPPELINQMIDAYFKENYSIAICTRESRDESFFRKKTSSLFYRIIQKLSFPNMPKGGFDLFLVGSKVKDLIVRANEANPFLQGQILWTGFKIKFIPYERKKREHGTSKWTFSKKIKYLIDGVMAYSYFPLRFMTVTGLIISSIGFLYAIVIFFCKIFGGIAIKGWAPIMIIILVLSGFQMLMLGIIGEYLWRTLDQVRRREPYIIEKIYE